MQKQAIWLKKGPALALRSVGRMTNFFLAGSDLVRWEIVTLGASGPFKLSVQHGKGTIVEYFTSSNAALRREQEIEALLLASAAPAPSTAWAS